MKNQNSSFFWAIVLTSVGIAYLFKNFGMLQFSLPKNLISWRLIPLIVGINAFWKGKNMEGIIAVSLAVIFYIPDFLTDPQILVYRKLWPLLLVAAGALVLSNMYFPSINKPTASVLNKDAQSFDSINETCIMGGSSNKVVSNSFVGGRLNALMGGMELDLREAELADNAILKVFIVMGGFELTVPKEWNIKIDVLPIMGGVDDQIKQYPSDIINTEKKLFISGNIVMGGIHIKRV